MLVRTTATATTTIPKIVITITTVARTEITQSQSVYGRKRTVQIAMENEIERINEKESKVSLVHVCVKKRALLLFSLSIYVYLRSGNSCNKISALISNTKHSHTTHCRELSTTKSRQTETSKCTMCVRGENQTLVIIAILFWRSSMNVLFLFSSNWVALHLITCWLARYLVYMFLFTRLIRLLVSIHAQCNG